MKLLILGDSHIAAYRAALDGGYPLPDGTSVSFFGAPGDALRSLTLTEGVLGVAHAPAAAQLDKLWGTRSFDLAGIDRVAVAGMGSSARLLGPLYRTHRTDTMAPGELLVSADTFEAATRGLLAASLFARVVEVLTSGCATEVIGLPQPLPSPALLDREPKNWIGEAMRNGDGDRLRDQVERARARLGLHTVIAQPEATLHAPLLTKAEFMQGGARLNTRNEADDVGHANAAYAAIVLDRLFAKVEARD